MSKANADRVETTNVVAVQHIDPTGKVQPAGDSSTNPIFVTSVGGGGTVIYGTDAAGVNFPTALCVAGAAIQFDITGFVDLATLKQINITQLTSGNYDYTLEIWEKDSSGYIPGTYTDHYLKIFSRDIDQREYNENIDGGLLYRDQDATQELHMRLVNNAGGTDSTFNVSVVATED